MPTPTPEEVTEIVNKLLARSDARSRTLALRLSRARGDERVEAYAEAVAHLPGPTMDEGFGAQHEPEEANDASDE